MTRPIPAGGPPETAFNPLDLHEYCCCRVAGQGEDDQKVLEARTSWPGPKYFLIVFALAGDSTTTIFMEIQWVKGCFRRASGRNRPRHLPGTWGRGPPLSN